MISPALFSKALLPLLSCKRNVKIAIAVSGGADSMCLALLTHQWTQDRGGRVIALTVDHLLRPESTDEAFKVHQWLSRRGIEHHTITWEKSEIPANLQTSARIARYELLLSWCKKNHISYLAVAHNMSDQCETILQRLSHHSGPMGLAGIPNKRQMNSINIIRPLLSFSRQQITETLKQLDQQWIEDPSNLNQRFTRIKIRSQRHTWDKYGLTQERLTQFQSKMATYKKQLEQEINIFYANHVVIHLEGYAQMQTQNFIQLTYEVQKHLLVRLLNVISGQAYPARDESLMSALMHIQRAKHFACHGCLIQINKKTIILSREIKHVSPAIHFEKDGKVRWDNRFELSIQNQKIENLRVEALGKNQLKFKNFDKLKAMPCCVSHTLPSVWQKERLLCVPHLDYYDGLKGDVEINPLFLHA